MSSYFPGNTIIACEATLIFVAWILVITRIIVRRIERQNHLILSDAFLVLAAVSSLAMFGCDVWAYTLGVFQASFEFDSTYALNSFVWIYFFDGGLYLPKFSILAFYFQIVHPSSRKMRLALYILTGGVVSCCVAALLGDTFVCVGTDTKKNWDMDWINSGGCTSISSLPWFKVLWGMNFTADVLIFLFPFPLLSSLRFNNMAERIGLLAIFCLGLITMGVSIARFCIYLENSANLSLFVWAMAEFTVAIMVVSLPALRPLVRKILPRKTNRSQNEASFSYNTGSGTEKGRRWKPSKSNASDMRSRGTVEEFMEELDTQGSNLELKYLGGSGDLHV